MAFLENENLVKETALIISQLSSDDLDDVEHLYKSELEKVSWRNRVKSSSTNALSLMSLIVPDDEIKKYEQNVRAYMERYRAHLNEKMRWKKARRANQIITLSISNQGSAPAHSVCVSLHFPPNIMVYQQIVADEKYEDLVELQFDQRKPKRPEMPSTFRDPLWGLVSPSFKFDPPSEINLTPDVYGPDITLNQDGSSTIEQGIGKVQHKLVLTLSQFLLVAPQIKDSQRYEVSYELRADNIEPLDGILTLHLRLNVAGRENL